MIADMKATPKIAILCMGGQSLKNHQLMTIDHTNNHGGTMTSGTRTTGQIEKMMMITGTKNDQQDGEVTRVHHAEAGKQVLKPGVIHNGTNRVEVGANHRMRNVTKALLSVATTRIPRLTEYPYHENHNHLHNHQPLGNESTKEKGKDHLHDLPAETEHALRDDDGHRHQRDPGVRHDDNQPIGSQVELDNDHRHPTGDHRRHVKDRLLR